MEKGNDRRYFRVAKKVLIKVIALFNEDRAIEDIAVSKEDNDFLVSYSFEDGPKDVQEQEDFGFNINHRIGVSPFAMTEFVEMLNADAIVGHVLVTKDSKEELIVVYMHGDSDEKRKQNSGG